MGGQTVGVDPSSGVYPGLTVRSQGGGGGDANAHPARRRGYPHRYCPDRGESHP